MIHAKTKTKPKKRVTKTLRIPQGKKIVKKKTITPRRARGKTCARPRARAKPRVARKRVIHKASPPALLKLLAIILMVSLNGAGLSAFGYTMGYYNDTESSTENTFRAGEIDFTIAADDWSPEDTAGALQPGDTITRNMSVLEGGSIPFQYKLKTVKTSGDDAFCNALDLVATRDGGGPLYSGDLMSFDLTPPVVIEGDGQDDWIFEVTLPSGSGPFDEDNCEFRFDVDGWQIGFVDGSSGFSDHEELENILESAVAPDESEAGEDNISPIADSYVDQDDEDENNGTSDDLKVRSQSGGKNKRAFIRFSFLFPSGTTIQSADLRLFLDDAPSSNRTYAVARSLSSWTETGITWDNQPAVADPSTDSVSTGTTNDVWRSWDVTDDVSGFVDGTFSNYGWSIFDTAENSTTSREGKFSSRNEDDEDKRPVLEIAFSALPATTTHLVVNEVYYDVGDGKGSEGTNEWVEIYNPTDVAVDVKNWQICDASSCDTLATTSPSILIPSHGFAVITPNASTWTKWTIPVGVIQIVLGSDIGGGLANGGDAVILKNASSVEIDAMSYGSNTSKLSPSVSDGPEGTSVARIVKGYDVDLATDWIINATPNPGTNPSDSGVEIMRFTDVGVEVADYKTGLDPLTTTVSSQIVELIEDLFVPLEIFGDISISEGITSEVVVVPETQPSVPETEIVPVAVTETIVEAPAEEEAVPEVITEILVEVETPVVSEPIAEPAIVQEEPAIIPEEPAVEPEPVTEMAPATEPAVEPTPVPTEPL